MLCSEHIRGHRWEEDEEEPKYCQTERGIGRENLKELNEHMNNEEHCFL